LNYRLYGLTVRSDTPIPGLPTAGENTGADLDIRLDVDAVVPPASEGRPIYESDWLDEDGKPTLRAWRSEAGFRLTYNTGPSFFIDRATTRITIAKPPGVSFNAAAYYLLGPVVGFVLRLRGILCLHASGVPIGGRAVLFVGGCGAGKSTLAASFARAGYPILGDDLAAICAKPRHFWVQPSYPGLRLWPEAVEHVIGNDALPKIAPEWEKRYLDLDTSRGGFASAPTRIAVVYLLDVGGTQTAIEAISPRDAVVRLVANTYANYLLDMPRRAAELQCLGALVAAVPVRQLRRPSGFDYLAETMDAVLTDVALLSRAEG